MGDRRGLGCAVRQGVDPACDTFQRTVLEESLNPHLSLYFHIYKMGLRDRTKCQSCWGSVTRKRICPQSVQCKPGPPRMLTPFLSSLIPFLCLLFLTNCLPMGLLWLHLSVWRSLMRHYIPLSACVFRVSCVDPLITLTLSFLGGEGGGWGGGDKCFRNRD